MGGNPDGLEKSLMKSITLPKLREVLGELGEIGLDSVTEDGLAKDIPIIGFVIKLHATYTGIRELHFLKKVRGFLYELSKFSLHERQEWNEKLEENPDEQRKVGEAILLLLDRVDSVEKSQIIARLFMAHIQGKIDYQICLHLSAMVERAYLFDLIALTKSNGHPTRLVAENLANIGIMSPNVSSDLQSQDNRFIDSRMSASAQSDMIKRSIQSMIDRVAITYSINDYGQMLLKYGLEMEISRL